MIRADGPPAEMSDTLKQFFQAVPPGPEALRLGLDAQDSVGGLVRFDELGLSGSLKEIVLTPGRTKRNHMI